jgi:hypothetical protein
MPCPASTRAPRAARVATRLTALALALAASACAGPRQLRPFRTDGCSLWPDAGLGTGHSWRHCCVEHDLAYWRGGTREEREAADAALRRCVEAATGNASLAETMYLGVRVGGTAWLPTWFRWGYGWAYDRPSAPLTPEERRAADREAGRWRDAHPDEVAPKAGARP